MVVKSDANGLRVSGKYASSLRAKHQKEPQQAYMDATCLKQSNKPLLTEPEPIERIEEKNSEQMTSTVMKEKQSESAMNNSKLSKAIKDLND